MSSPPMQPNGGGGWSDTCPYGVYLTYDECLQNNGWDEEYCSCVCDYSGSCGGLCELTDEYWDCVDEQTSHPVYYASIIIGCGVGCIVTDPGWPLCVKGCIIGASVAPVAVYTGCLFVEGAYEC
ncbi:MAG: hypothetical protein R6W73_03995 [Candidatus Saliniplasma sp.]